jgi:hypothetical protein
MMRRMVCVPLFFAALAGLSLAQSSSSTKADTSREAIVFERIENVARFQDDGTSTQDATAVIRVQSQAGVQARRCGFRAICARVR